MVVTRLIARLDIKAPYLVKGVHLEGLRKIGDPHEYAVKYADEGADELLYMDIVASLYGRSQILELLERTTDDVFIPVTVGGGIRSKQDVKRLFDAGADKVALNTGAIRRPRLISDIADAYGCQAVVVSIEAKRTADARMADGWECYTDCGRERTGRDAVSWAYEAVERGAGEILITSIDREGTRNGFDSALVRAIADTVSTPVVACGGMGEASHFAEVVLNGGADAVAMADILHYGRASIHDIKAAGKAAGLTVRQT